MSRLNELLTLAQERARKEVTDARESAAKEVATARAADACRPAYERLLRHAAG